MKNNVVLDTSYLSALLVERDFHHTEALVLFKKLLTENKSIIIPICVLLELELIPKALDNESFYEIIHEFLSKIDFQQVNLDSSFLDSYRTINKAIPYKITAIDLSVIVTTALYDAELVTFDKKMKKSLNLSK